MKRSFAVIPTILLTILLLSVPFVNATSYSVTIWNLDEIELGGEGTVYNLYNITSSMTFNMTYTNFVQEFSDNTSSSPAISYVFSVGNSTSNATYTVVHDFNDTGMQYGYSTELLGESLYSTQNYSSVTIQWTSTPNVFSIAGNSVSTDVDNTGYDNDFLSVNIIGNYKVGASNFTSGNVLINVYVSSAADSTGWSLQILVPLIVAVALIGAVGKKINR